MRVISFDPGGTTGVALFDEELDWGGWKRWSLGPGPHHLQLWDVLQNEYDIVFETFNYQRRDVDKGVALELISRNYIGIIELRAAMSHSVNIYPQSPSRRMFWDDDKLRELGLWISSPHERDATRHLLQHITFTLKDKRFLKLLKP